MKHPQGKTNREAHASAIPGPKQRVASQSSAMPVQRQLGNALLQQVATAQGPLVQRACSCGGSCASCSGQDEHAVQAKLTVGPANDRYEREADRVAQQVVGMSNTPVESSQTPAASIQRMGGASGGTNASVSSLPMGESRPLSRATRQFMEPRFGADFSQVRVHAGPKSESTAQDIHARAFTHQNHIWLGKGAAESDRSLMAHELTHVVQQGAANTVQRSELMTSQNAPAVIQRENRPPPAPEPTPAPALHPGRLPCSSRTTIDISPVHLPGSTGNIASDVASANSILCQCGITLNVVGGESWATNLLDMNLPHGVLNAPSGTVRQLTDEEKVMLAHKPQGPDPIYVYYVPDFSGPKVAEAFWPAQHGERAFAISNSPNADSFAHELGHVLLNDGSHHRDRDNLMASGTVRNVGVSELTDAQCGQMP